VTFATACAVVLAVLALQPQPSPADRNRARIQVRLGVESFKAERFAEAGVAFHRATEIDPEYDTAYYWLGRTNMAQKKFAEAVAAYEKARGLYTTAAGRQFRNAQEMQRFRSDRMIEIDEMIRQVQQGPQNAQTQDQLRQLQERRRQMQEAIQRGTDMTIDQTVPPWITLALGSAYFRAGRMGDAEREYRATLATDSKVGEAHNNLAVVYLQTGRYDDAERALAAAKKVGFRIHPQLEEDIKAARRK
jgi:tetratricopeptide (TPR) repeat protein